MLAMNRAPTETCASAAYRMRPSPGGSMLARMDPALVSATLNGLGNPRRSMVGTIIFAIAAASAVDDPDGPPMSTFVRTLTWPQTAAEMPDQRCGERHQCLGDGACVHQSRCEE